MLNQSFAECNFQHLNRFIFFQDEDTSYLDEATRAPDAPLREPGADSIVPDKDGVLVDEFGLPKIPAQQCDDLAENLF